MARYEGPWSRPADDVSVEGALFDLAADAAKSANVTLKTMLIQ